MAQGEDDARIGEKPAYHRQAQQIQWILVHQTLPGANLAGMQANESQWNYVIDYIRIWRPAP